jgi:hypothetical protein
VTRGLGVLGVVIGTGAPADVDIPCDPTQIDQTGLAWAFLDEAARPNRIVEGAVVLTGDSQDPVAARVVSLTVRPTGIKVHLQILPDDPSHYVDAARPLTR